MKKMKINKLVILASLFTVFISCRNEDDLEDVRTGGKSVVTIDQIQASAIEGEEITFTLTIDKPSSSDIDYKIELVGGTGSFRDFTSDGVESDISEGGYAQGAIGYKLVFPAYATTATFTITPVRDFLIEGNETLEIWLRSSGNGLGLVDDSSNIINIDVIDYVSDDLGVQLEWDQNYTDIYGTIQPGIYLGADGDDHAYADYDYDLYVEDAFGSPVDGYAGATSASPEFVELASASLPDGDYYIYVDLWSAGTTPAETFDHDLKINMTKYGVWTTSVPVPTTSDDTFSDYVVGFTKTGGTYVVFNAYDDTEVYASGRAARRHQNSPFKVKK